jgi:hypothetical protein
MAMARIKKLTPNSKTLHVPARKGKTIAAMAKNSVTGVNKKFLLLYLRARYRPPARTAQNKRAAFERASFQAWLSGYLISICRTARFAHKALIHISINEKNFL